jgi:glycine/D-amino acid oxidase-like deaminating enzyme
MADVIPGGHPDADVAVIGGGILGLASAALAAQRGYTAIVLRLSNEGRPRADTLRNQGWLQSGLMYVGRLGADRRRGRILANKMYNAGLVMLESLGLPVPNGEPSGVLRVRSQDEADHLLADAAALGFSDVVREVEPSIIRQRLGPVFEEDTAYYSIPDAPFPEALVLELLRMRAAEAGVHFVECDKPVCLKKNDRSPSGHGIHCGETTIVSKVTVIAAGAGSYGLLRDLEVDPKMKFQQTPLLVLDGCHSIEVPIFVDRPRGFSFVQHPAAGDHLPEGALVIGTTAVDEDVDFVPFEERKITRARVAEFREKLPDCFRGYVEVGRFTAGFEVIPVGIFDDEGYELHYVEPWVRWFGVDDGLRLLVAMPGRATMGMLAAEMVLNELEAHVECSANPLVRPELWEGDIFMHFHRIYDFDDRE